LDPFAGPNTTGAVAEQIGRHWLAVEKDETYAKDSELRFQKEASGKANGQSLLFDFSES
jgi:site-specific DNA-methyltransferase (cytosine-N4-specific)